MSDFQIGTFGGGKFIYGDILRIPRYSSRLSLPLLASSFCVCHRARELTALMSRRSKKQETFFCPPSPSLHSLSPLGRSHFLQIPEPKKVR